MRANLNLLDYMNKIPVDVDLLLETSWEVCNKVGGIYTVLSTKAKNLQKVYKDKVIFIGPDVWSPSSPSPYFIESTTILKSWRQTAKFPDGVKVRVGRWDIPGKPIAILVSFDGMYAVKDELYGEMWERFGVDSLHAYGDYDEACAFSHAAAVVIESLYNYMECGSKRVIAHFDEWTTGMGLLYIKAHIPEIATVFTTHATSIGRSICGNGKPLYDYLKGYNGDQMAGELNMQSKHSLEKAAATQADCFTTVSDITAIECSQLLDRAPDVVTPNGFEPTFVPAKTKYKTCRHTARRALLEVASALTGKNFSDDTFIVATSGRCEYRNKGIDLYLDTMARLRGFDLPRKVLSFVMVPAWCDTARDDLRTAIENKSPNGLDNPVITHSIHNFDCDPIYNRLRSLGFEGDDEVTVIYVPCYLNGNDGIFNLTYYQLLIGLDATVFPSYYEPWGYTPLESIAFGVPTVTTSLSGFGQWILRGFTDSFESTGVYVVERSDSNYDAVVDSISRSLNFLICSDRSVNEMISRQAVSTAAKANWSIFIDYYYDAFEIAFAHAEKRNKK